MKVLGAPKVSKCPSPSFQDEEPSYHFYISKEIISFFLINRSFSEIVFLSPLAFFQRSNIHNFDISSDCHHLLISFFVWYFFHKQGSMIFRPIIHLLLQKLFYHLIFSPISHKFIDLSFCEFLFYIYPFFSPSCTIIFVFKNLIRTFSIKTNFFMQIIFS